ncbi:MAG: hypothetical protein AAGM22_21790 [Acidobacteriota bacterium]
MGSRGEWLVQMGKNLVLFDDEGRGVVLPSTREPAFALAMAGEDPVILVLSSKAGGWAVLRWDGDEWSDWVRVDGDGRLDVGLAMEKADAFLTISSKDRLWLARRYSEEIRQFSPSGRSLLDLRVGDGQVVHGASDPSTEERVAKSAERVSRSARGPKRQGRTVAFTAKPTYHAVAVDSFHQAYFLKLSTGPEGGYVIQRWNPVDLRLEETDVDLPGPSAYTMAFGKAGLHLAPFNAAGGRFFVSSESLDKASWRPTQEVTVNGFAETDRTAKEAPSSE